ncbi:PASTA domain-containing protein [Acrocarpospora pleiomorpha]|uniref:PASTA domain-containing protein n=1 Tax=Acrocarpospora pleiomorpha TaxID=90975 RepID=UPI001FEC31C7|nr:PASTA domain-containing protein [Acrocarpospora pleiomorpha]
MAYTMKGENSASVAADVVIGTNPAAGKTILSGESLTVRLSEGAKTVKVPPLIGLTEAQAVQALSTAGLTADMRRGQSNAKQGQVYDSSPDVGTSVASGSTVTVYLPADKPQVETVNLPNFIGMGSTDARTALRNLGLYARFEERPSEVAGQGVVIDQNPREGTAVAKGLTVVLFISSGPSPTDFPTDSATDVPTDDPFGN